ncbi:MAG: ParA family protein [Candidatus Bipolaricaulota bacterium]|nr:ParA family protein [Candidatus Bipolaricaulota bacterium]MDW8031304.1 ParA family protein [Candidatus Bipolaricaulota bacterium]
MRRIAITNQKGGSGKTTTVVNLAATLGERQRRVLVIDLDPQCSATSWFGIKNPDKGIFRAFVENGNVLEIISQTNVPNVEVVPASPWLVGADKALAGEVGAETILRRQLQSLPHGRWDYLMIDCPPALGILTINALVAVTEVLVPVEAHVLALEGLAQLLQTIEVVKERLNPELKICGILACRVDGRTRHAQEVVEHLRSRFGNLVYKTVIRENVRLAECPSFGKPITQYDLRSYGAQDYRALAAEVIRQERGR